MQGLLNGRTNLQGANHEALAETVQELITELSYRFSHLSDENFTQEGLKELKKALEAADE